MKVKVTNICARFETGCKLNLEEILKNDKYLCFDSKKFEKKRFSALIAKYRETKLTFLIFHTGTCVVTGGQKQYTIKRAVNDFIRHLKTVGFYRARNSKFKFTNFCISSNLNKNINLDKLSKEKPQQTSYFIELFVNAKYKFQGKIFTITHKGRVFTTGLKTKKGLKKLIKELRAELKPYFK